MTIHTTPGPETTHTTQSVSDLSTRRRPLHAAYAHYLHVRAEGFAMADIISDDALADLLDQEEAALLAFVRTQATCLDDVSLKVGLLATLLEAHGADHPAAMLAGALIADLRSI